MKVVELHKSNFRNPAETLRVIADEIEKGQHGDVRCVGVAMLGNGLEVFGLGEDSEPANVAMVLHAGFMYFQKAYME